MSMQYGPIDRCQVCAAPDLHSALFLGYLPPVNTMRPIGAKPDMESWYPAELLYCPTCCLVQLGFAVDPTILFPPEYPYTSGSTRILRENFAELYREVYDQIGLQADALIVDIGSNDGTLLSNFQEGGCRVVGIEPTLAGEIALQHGIPTLMTFFDQASVHQVQREFGTPKIVTATNVFAHIHGIHQVLDLIEQLVGTRGVFVSESHYLRDLIETLQYDTIYHEHLRYYSLASLSYLLMSHGFRVFHAKRIPTHGGSIRVYASKSEAYVVDASVARLLREEEEVGLTSTTWIAELRERVVCSKLGLYELLTQLKRERKRIYGIGAPSRASTLVNHVGLDDRIVDYVLEIKTSKKVGKYLPGTNIPVIDEAILYEDQPPYVLLLSWHIADELCRNLKRRGYGGDFIVPLPTPHIIPNAEVIL